MVKILLRFGYNITTGYRKLQALKTKKYQKISNCNIQLCYPPLKGCVFKAFQLWQSFQKFSDFIKNYGLPLCIPCFQRTACQYDAVFWNKFPPNKKSFIPGSFRR